VADDVGRRIVERIDAVHLELPANEVLQRAEVVFDGVTDVNVPRIAIPVVAMFQSSECAPTTGWSIPPIRPSKGVP
jgi:hypothetical protein